MNLGGLTGAKEGYDFYFTPWLRPGDRTFEGNNIT